MNKKIIRPYDLTQGSRKPVLSDLSAHYASFGESLEKSLATTWPRLMPTQKFEFKILGQESYYFQEILAEFESHLYFSLLIHANSKKLGFISLSNSLANFFLQCSMGGAAQTNTDLIHPLSVTDQKLLQGLMEPLLVTIMNELKIAAIQKLALSTALSSQELTLEWPMKEPFYHWSYQCTNCDQENALNIGLSARLLRKAHPP